jgi:hypothetical protein
MVPRYLDVNQANHKFLLTKYVCINGWCVFNNRQTFQKIPKNSENSM